MLDAPSTNKPRLNDQSYQIHACYGSTTGIDIIKFDRVPSANLENAVGDPRRKPTCRWTSWSINKPNTVNETITSYLFLRISVKMTSLRDKIYLPCRCSDALVKLRYRTITFCVRILYPFPTNAQRYSD